MIPTDVLYMTGIILLVASCTVAGSSLLSVYSDAADEEQRGNNCALNGDTGNNGYDEVTWVHALSFPVVSSLSLVSLFFFFNYLQYVLFLVLVIGAFAALHQLTVVLFDHSIYINKCSSRTKAYLSTTFASLVVAHWMWTGHWLSHDLLCSSLCVIFIHTLRFPSFKLVVVCLSLLLVYDAFWVFYSEYFFEKNVMVTVATQKASNPVRDAAQLLHVSASILSYFPTTVELPMKMIFPVQGRLMMLGLGDVALPGAVVAFALRCDLQLLRHRTTSALQQASADLEQQPPQPPQQPQHAQATGLLLSARSLDKDQGPETSLSLLRVLLRPSQLSGSLFASSLLAYVAGLCIAFVANFLSRRAQPALVYLVPCVLLSIAIAAGRQGSLCAVWDGVDAHHKQRR